MDPSRGPVPLLTNSTAARPKVLDEVKFAVVEKVLGHFRSTLGKEKVIDIDGARILFDHGWGLVRASNTQPALVVRFEADSQAHLDDIRATVERAIEAVRT